VKVASSPRVPPWHAVGVGVRWAVSDGRRVEIPVGGKSEWGRRELGSETRMITSPRLWSRWKGRRSGGHWSGRSGYPRIAASG